MKFDEKKIKFLTKVALEYRLSLKNICKFIGIELTSQNEKTILDEFLGYQLNQDDGGIFNYLLYETDSELEKDENISYQAASLFFSKLKRANLSESKEKINEVLKELNKIDRNFETVKKNFSKKELSKDDIMAISKYRIKYGLSRREMANILGCYDSVLLRKEKLIDSEYIKRKLEKLNNYQLDNVVHNYRYCKSKIRK